MHGGDIYSNLVLYDFSVNLNPLGIPESVKQALCSGLETLNAYPDSECNELRTVLASCLSASGNTVVSLQNIVVGNGASELIPAVLRACNAKKVLLLAPGFTGYKHAISAVHAESEYFMLCESCEFEFGDKESGLFINKIIEFNPQIVIITNPNNPNGKFTKLDILKKIADVCKKNNTLLLIDECFIQLSSYSSDTFIQYLSNYKNVVVLRAFTKTFALAGLRLGYSVCTDNDFNKKLIEQLSEWNVSSLAQCGGISALKEIKSLSKARNIIYEQKKIISEKLITLGFTVFPSDANFILFKSNDIYLKEKLLRKKILIRQCEDYNGLGKNFFRIAVKPDIENQILINALEEVKND